jgi:hypothetical protein
MIRDLPPAGCSSCYWRWISQQRIEDASDIWDRNGLRRADRLGREKSFGSTVRPLTVEWLVKVQRSIASPDADWQAWRTLQLNRKILAVAGGLLMVYVFGDGGASVDARRLAAA